LEQQPHFCGKLLKLELLIRYLLPLFYVLLIGWWLARNQFLQASGLQRWFVLGFFSTKVIAGLIYTWVMLQFIPSAVVDIETFFGGGLEMYRAFWEDPAGFPAFLAETFYITDFSLGRTDSDFIRTVFDGIKVIHFLLNFLSGGELYTNVVLFNCLASWLFLRCWVYLKHLSGNWWLGAWVYLFPSAFFFTSVILKEGIEWMLIAAIIPLLYNITKKSGWAKVTGLLILFFLLFFFKYLIAFTFFGAILLFYLFKKHPALKGSIAFAATILSIVLFFGIGKLVPALNLPQYIVDRRLEFQDLEANTALSMQNLEPNLKSFLQALPECLHNVLFRPWPGEGGKLTYLVFSAEIMAFWAIWLFLFIRNRKEGFSQPGPEAWAYFLFALINLMIIGYTITNIGAIIRYRSIFLPGLGYFLWVILNGRNFMNVGFIKRFFPL
jgi:hypothetical protein